MKMTSRTLVNLALLILPTSAFAQDLPAPTDRWGIGAGVSIFDSPYAGEGTRIQPLPLINYEGKHLFLNGISGGVHLYQTSQFTFDAILSARLSGFDINDLGRSELLDNGVDSSLLSDRDDGLDAGIRATLGSSWGAISLEAVHDISDTSDGYEISLNYRYGWLFNQTAVTANAGASWMSSDLGSYYFGILDKEVSRGVSAYSPGSAVIPSIGMTLVHTIGSSKWQIIGSAEYQFLPSELRNSPLIDPDHNGMGRVIVGLSRRF